MSTAKAPSYILRYFNLAGRGETARLLLAAANVEWTEENPKWPQEKANQPFGRLPVLIEKSTDGSPDFVICESTNIERYIARIYGILPADPKQSAIQEQLREQLVDVVNAFFTHTSSISEEDKKLRLESFEEILSKIIAVQTKIIKDNGNTGRMFGDSLSYADIASYAFYRCMVFGYKMFKNDIVDIVKPKLTPEIIKLISTVETDPALATHLSKAKVLSAELSA
ncbi:hypothetical protein COEREDRAFT_79650 [Coemansia reversa NRRL 1564]|uniref:GST N-terminal domain-containing protein n=1 Tax=Coemansia reversa (strain ATCC 12441 / NRRL 1564) TaxID=763665 RepID=A0A2G5BHX5_COERN|nr:hypothetical protein COEREDRAFT_79650 [Coemansia reversa NRRL 1564]|eukprot:PIA18624.1 hypothetical protein COEREDRAFT_79650 [Coemansia reversa NRRL 1564]